MSLRNCIKMEIGLAQHFTNPEYHDFRTGVKAKLIEKSNEINWIPTTISEVNNKLVEKAFENEVNIDFANPRDLNEYTHQQFSLPTFFKIKKLLKQDTKKECWSSKPGLSDRFRIASNLQD